MEGETELYKQVVFVMINFYIVTFVVIEFHF